MKIPEDIIIQPNQSGFFILYNVFTRTSLAIDTKGMDVVRSLAQQVSMDVVKGKYENDKFNVVEIGFFSNYEGLLADPTRIIRDHTKWPKPKTVAIVEFIQLLENNYILVDEKKYESIFSHKLSLLDKEHLGNFHEQLGQVLMVEKRENPGEWWVRQKFSGDYKDLNETLYKYVQGDFLENFFKKRFNSSHKILDIGCGIGHYTDHIGNTGAQVLGIDPNEKYIEIARKNSSNATFKVSNIGNTGDLSWIESNSFDYVFMSDALLFYFVSPDPKQKQDISVLFSDIRRILKPNGRFFSMEPHGLFWLRPWFGDENRPFTIVTEYKNKRFNVTPTYSEIIGAFIKNGFSLIDFKELGIEDSMDVPNSRGVGFAKEFPLWWFFELGVQK